MYYHLQIELIKVLVVSYEIIYFFSEQLRHSHGRYEEDQIQRVSHMSGSFVKYI